MTSLKTVVELYLKHNQDLLFDVRFDGDEFTGKIKTDTGFRLIAGHVIEVLNKETVRWTIEIANSFCEADKLYYGCIITYPFQSKQRHKKTLEHAKLIGVDVLTYSSIRKVNKLRVETC